MYYKKNFLFQLCGYSFKIYKSFCILNVYIILISTYHNEIFCTKTYDLLNIFIVLLLKTSYFLFFVQKCIHTCMLYFKNILTL